MSHRIGLNPTLALNILRQHGVDCELRSNGGEYRITGHLHDIVYSVDFYEAMARGSDTFLSLRLQAAKSLGDPIAPQARLRAAIRLLRAGFRPKLRQ